MQTLHLIVGLGNPGRDYVGTRHNVGFALVQELAGRWRARWKFEKKFQADLARAEQHGHRLILCCPQTFMNASGDAVGPLVEYYKVPLERMLVVVDDADLPLGEIRLRPGGSSGGHHGLESIQTRLGSQDYPRLRLGIGRRHRADREITGHVLGRFSRQESPLVEKVLDAAAAQVECWLETGIQKAMSLHNGRVDDELKKDAE